jgi:hypothetical protein
MGTLEVSAPSDHGDVIKMVNDRELVILGTEMVQKAFKKSTPTEWKELVSMAARADFGHGEFNHATEAFVQMLLSGQKLPDLERWQQVNVYAAAQRILAGYRSEAASYENLKRDGERVKHGELAGTFDEDRLAYVESRLSPQARKLLVN